MISPTIAIEDYHAKVVSRHGALLIVKDEQGVRHACISPKKYSHVVCGDNVRCTVIDQDRDQLIELLPRHNELLRQTEFSTKIVAANIDILAITCAIEPEPSLDLIDQYIVAAENLLASAVIVINKTDLPTSSAVITAVKKKYDNLSYPIIETSVKSHTSLNKLAEQFINNTCVFVGQSGVGKSTLIDAIIPSVELESQTISEGIQQGKHTTSVTTLYDLPQGGELIDSPGVRDFSLPKLDKEKIIKGFLEIRKLSAKCKFHNCVHLLEPDCAVKLALNKGEINEKRYSSYKKMMEQLSN